MLLRRLRIWFARGTQLQASMEQDLYVEQQVPSGLLTGVHFNFLTEADIEKMSVLQIAAANEVTDTRLGLPNPLSECFSCGVRDTKNCEGHCGYIEFPITILHPQRISEVAHILNQFCPACKSNRQNLWVKVRYFKIVVLCHGYEYAFKLLPFLWLSCIKVMLLCWNLRL